MPTTHQPTDVGAYTPPAAAHAPPDDVALTPAQQRALSAAFAWAWRHRVVHAVATALLVGGWPAMVQSLTGHTAGSARDSVQDARLAVLDTAIANGRTERRELRAQLSVVIRIGCRGLPAAERDLVPECDTVRARIAPAAFAARRDGVDVR